LPLELVVRCLDGGLLLTEELDLVFELGHFVPLLRAASDSTFSVLKTFSSLFVFFWVSFVIEDATPIFDLLIQVLLFFLGVAANERRVTIGVVLLSTRDVLSLLGSESVSLGVTWPLGALGYLAVKFLLLLLITALFYDLERVVVGRVGWQRA